MIHKPTGLQAIADSRCQHQNKKKAKAVLEDRVVNFINSKKQEKIDSERKNQVGSGMRGDKIRTYREQDNLVINHESNKKVRLSDIKKGKLELIWKNK